MVMLFRKLLPKLIYTIIITLLYLFIFIPSATNRIASFGCFDDCTNIMAGYFIKNGKSLYSEIFFNHSPLMAYISYFIQSLFDPKTIFELIKVHRIFLLVYFLSFNLILIFRFGLKAFLFAIIFESTKGYYFGDRFIGESILVYPLVYLIFHIQNNIISKSLIKKFKISRTNIIEIISIPIFIYFIIFTREPYVPLAVFIYILYFINQYKVERKIVLITLFILLSTSLISILNLSPLEFFDQVVNVNAKTVALKEIQNSNLIGLGSLNIIFYPILSLFTGIFTHARLLEVVATLILFIEVFYIKFNRIYIYLIIIITLSLANIRPTVPGQIYYSAFHHLIYWAVLLAQIINLFTIRFNIDLQKTEKTFNFSQFLKASINLSSLLYLTLFIISYFYSKSYLYEKKDVQFEFNTNYSVYYSIGSVVNRLKSTNDTLYLDGYNDLIYFQAGISSPYKYSWFTSVMPQIGNFMLERDKYLTLNPPTFLYTSCSNNYESLYELPKNLLLKYKYFTFENINTCLYISKDKIGEIGLNNLQDKISDLGYKLE